MGLPDVNVLIYAVDKKSPFHAACEKWLVETLNGAEPVSFTWHSLLGFVRISTNPRAMALPLTIDEAFDFVDEWLAQPLSHIVEPSDKHSGTLRSVLLAAGMAGNLVSDAHLAAIAIDHGVEIVSCDTDFARFPGLKWFNPVTGVRTK
ncbi:MAG TPA: type II toxin-antitoxin system VapC family toxin [Planctomycetota bacterium]|nr:type II toxin-antitoxin system VapC family toxin [Planctomycetota bacterium]